MNQDKTKRIWHGPYRGMPLTQVPTRYLVWTYGSFPGQRNYIVEELTRRGCTDGDFSQFKKKFPVLGKVPTKQEGYRGDRRLSQPQRHEIAKQHKLLGRK
jgi:hypothetical protein